MPNWRAFLLRRGTSFHPPTAVTQCAPHIRDRINLRRVMTYVMLALSPCVLMALYNTGYQANTAMATLGLTEAPGWRGAVLGTLRIGYDPSSIWASGWHGLIYVLPLYVVTVLVGALWQRLFAVWRRREVTEGFMVTALLFTLSLPPTVPLWQAALGISFGVVIGQEIFGGIGHNFLNPALAGRAFLYVTYPSELAGDAIWTAVDGFTGATSLSLAATGGMDAIAQQGITWFESFLGWVPGSLGETSTLASLFGAIFLLYTRIVSWRIIVGVLMGMIATVYLFNWIGSSANLMVGMPWYWHLTLGSFVFGTVFFATDPVSAATTDTGRWIYGLLIGFLVVLIRVASFAHPEGVMFAILLGNIFAPLIDHLVILANIRRRAQRSV